MTGWWLDGTEEDIVQVDTGQDSDHILGDGGASWETGKWCCRVFGPTRDNRYIFDHNSTTLSKARVECSLGDVNNKPFSDSEVITISKRACR
jgi:hypothetical protein